MVYFAVLLKVLAGIAGVLLIILTLSAAVRSFVLPRSEVVGINVWVFRAIRTLFDLAARLAKTYADRDRVMAHYAPVALVALPIVWLSIMSVGYTLVYWTMGEGGLIKCYLLSGSSLLTLGAHKSESLWVTIVTYSEATLGLLLLTLLLSYLPTIYQAFSRRETTVARIELRAGTPSSAGALLCWLNRSGALNDDDTQWEEWEHWFVEIEESHTSLPIITFFRSPQAGRSWVTAGGLILEAANLLFSVIDMPRSPQVELTFKAGCLALNRVYRFFEDEAGSESTDLVPHNDPTQDAGRADFEALCQELAEDGMAVRADRDAAWKHYQELRSRYATSLDFLAKLTMAPHLKTV